MRLWICHWEYRTTKNFKHVSSYFCCQYSVFRHFRWFSFGVVKNTTKYYVLFFIISIKYYVKSILRISNICEVIMLISDRLQSLRSIHFYDYYGDSVRYTHQKLLLSRSIGFRYWMQSSRLSRYKASRMSVSVMY